jgi:hypothetical protein
MLFLAVFCGFLAENQREHFVEAHRAKEYAKSLLNDLQQDTIELRGAVRYVNYFKSAFDSMESIYSRNHTSAIFPATFCFYSRVTSHSYNIDWNSSTINQLVQSGNLRYFKNKDLVDDINKYYSIQLSMTTTDNGDMAHKEKIRDMRNHLFDHTHLDSFLRMNMDSLVNVGPEPSPFLDSLSKQKINLNETGKNYLSAYMNYLTERRARFNVYINKWYPRALRKAEEIMQLLRKEYPLK